MALCRTGGNVLTSLRWRHNGHDCVSNHQTHHIKENIKAPRHWPLCGEFKWPVTRKILPFHDVIMMIHQMVRILALPLLQPEYPAITSSMSWLLMTWFLVSPGHHAIDMALIMQYRKVLPSTRRDCRDLCHITVDDVMTGKHLPSYWPFVREIFSAHRYLPLVNCQLRDDSMFHWRTRWKNSRLTGDVIWGAVILLWSHCDFVT